MTPERFRECVDWMAVRWGWTLRGLADVLQLDDRLVRRFYSGRATVPADVAEWLERVVRFHQGNPPPEPPQRREEDTASPRGSCPE